MATQKVVVEGSSGVTASQLKDLFRQIDDGSIDGSYMQSVLDHCIIPAKPADPKKLLRLMSTENVAAIESFKAGDHFKVDTKKAAVRIAWIGDNFKANFLGLSEGACESADLKTHKLLQSSLDAPIITELADKCEITLGQFFALLSKQGKGESGPLLTNGWANIAYIRDDEGNLWAVYAHWSAGRSGWNVEASSVEYPSGWDDGYQVMSR